MTEQPTQGRPSFVLVLFLLFPVIGLLVAGGMALSEALRPAATPAPVTMAALTSLIDQPAPNFELPALDGTTYRLSSYRGKVVFVNFWATWCEPCERELPALASFAAQTPDTAAVFAINTDEPLENITSYLSQYDVQSLNVMLDSGLNVYNSYGINRLPTTFVIDPSGTVRYMHLGEITETDLYTYLDVVGTPDEG